MKSNTPFVLIGILTGSLLVACAPSQVELDATSTQIAANIFATQTAEAPKPTPTPTLTATPTITPTPTSTPRPFSDAVLTLEDLPPGFVEEPLADFDVEPGIGAAMVVNVIESGFAFSIETEVFQVITGQTELLTLRTEQAEYDSFAQTLGNVFMAGISQVISGEDPKDLEEILNLDDIGDASNGLTAIVGGVPPIRTDVIFFRRGKIGALIWTFYFDGDSPVVPIGDLGRKLDVLIIDLLAQD